MSLCYVSTVKDIKDACAADPCADGVEENRYLVLALGADGMDPNGNSGSAKQYSIWPFLVVVLNCPIWVRSTKSHAMLWLLTQGPQQPASMEPYLQYITTELNKLTTEGVATWDAYKCEWFTLRVAMCFIAADSRGKVRESEYLRTHIAP